MTDYVLVLKGRDDRVEYELKYGDARVASFSFPHGHVWESGAIVRMFLELLITSNHGRSVELRSRTRNGEVGRFSVGKPVYDRPLPFSRSNGYANLPYPVSGDTIFTDCTMPPFKVHSAINNDGYRAVRLTLGHAEGEGLFAMDGAIEPSIAGTKSRPFKLVRAELKLDPHTNDSYVEWHAIYAER